MKSIYLADLAAHRELLQNLDALDERVTLAGARMAEALHGGGKILLCGNGGSAADCQHVASELTGRFVNDRRALAAIALTTDSSALTSIANDYAFDDVFARQVKALGRAGDVLIAISTSGRSRNVVRAVDAARELSMTTIGLLGRDGGELRDRCDVSITVPSESTARIQEVHIMIGHSLCGIVERALELG
ncbi:MAG: D-sedoheptulose 7-phosphate isomerase [Burkholderiales bacterium]|jgi:D-sedoheptulose 7-phosphate isomerase|nr:MAG: D-sedoheptulose 7-phosphate isomerase [Burkholderiales bacterium]